jgi:predicted murein hydrolase (TIGR00659 family)
MGDPAVVAFAVVLTVGIYALSRSAFLTYGYALLSPVFLSTLVIITVLSLCRIPFARYKPAEEIMTILLGPAVVALALPLYRQRHTILKMLPAVLAGVIGGSLVSLGAVVALARAAGLEKMIVVSLAPKSVTAPVAVEISRIVGGNEALTAAFVIATGVLGSMLGPWFLSQMHIHDPVARGLAVGTTAHGQGTAMMLQEGETQGALSGVAMALAAIFVSIVAPFAIPWLVTLRRYRQRTSASANRGGARYAARHERRRPATTGTATSRRVDHSPAAGREPTELHSRGGHSAAWLDPSGVHSCTLGGGAPLEPPAEGNTACRGPRRHDRSPGGADGQGWSRVHLPERLAGSPDGNLSEQTYPDQSLYASNSVPAMVRRINNALRRADQIHWAEGKNGIHWLAPIVADAEAGFGGPLNAFELMKSMIEAGVAGVHFEDQLASEKKCGHMGGKVLIPTSQFLRTLKAARLAADILGVPTILIARTDALAATLLTTDVDPSDREFMTGERTIEGFFVVRNGLEAAVARGLAYAPYADLLWFETSKPDLEEAAGLRRLFTRNSPASFSPTTAPRRSTGSAISTI